MYQVLGHYPIDGYEFSDLSDTIVHLRSRHYKTIVEREKEAKKEAAKSRYKAVLDKAIADLHSKPKEQRSPFTGPKRMIHLLTRRTLCTSTMTK